MKRQRILIIRLSAIGDTIHTIPLANALREKYPEAQIDWIVEDKAAQFILNNPLLDNVFVIPKKEWQRRGFSLKNYCEFNRLMGKVQANRYDIAIDVQQLFKSALVLKFCGAKRKITLSGGREFSGLFANEIVKAKHKLFDKNYHVVKRNLEIAEYLGADPEKIKFVLPLADKDCKKKVDELLKPIKKHKKTLVLAPATTWPSKHWLNSCWRALIEEYQGKANIILTGTENDKKLIDEILADNEYNVLNLCGQTNLSELTEIFRRADAVVAPDSGSAQIAWAAEKPFVVSIFTSTSKNRTAPFGSNAAAVSPELKCYPCHKKKCKSRNFELCKNSIDYYEIIKILNKVFNYS